MKVTLRGMQEKKFGDLAPGTFFLHGVDWYVRSERGTMVSLIDGREVGNHDSNPVLVPDDQTLIVILDPGS
jgi:hypothetical protein